MRTKLHIGLAVLLMAFSVPLFAQSERSTDLGAIVGFKYDAGLIGRMSVEVEEELRFENQCTRLDRWLNSVALEYPLMHNRIYVGVSGGVIRRYNERGYYENRGRVGVDVTCAETYRRFKFSFRSRLMATFRDESVGDYRINPKLYWRNRFQATYQMPNSRFKYSLSTELHWLLNDPKGSVIDNLRTVFTVNYRLSRHHSVSGFVRMDNDIQVKEPVDRFYFGVEYRIKY